MKILLFKLLMLSWLQISFTQKAAVPEYADLVFLVDSSSNLGEKGFSQVKTLITRIISTLPIGQDKYRVGLAKYNDDLDIGFLLNTYKGKGPVISHIKNKFAYKGGSLKLGNALTKVHEQFFKRVTDRDKSVYPPVLVVVTSGSSLDDVTQPALELQQDGVRIVSVGLQTAPLSQLQAIAASTKHVLQVSNIRDIPTVSTTLIDSIQDVVQSMTVVLPTPSGTDISVIPTITDEINITADICDQEFTADIVFIIDTSRHKPSESENLKGFLSNVISRLPISKNCAHVYLVKYGSQAELLAPLKTSMNKSSVLEAIRSITPMKEAIANTGHALNFTRTEVVADPKTSRKAQGIKQISILITHSLSADNVTDAAHLLRQEQVTSFALGIAEAKKFQMDQIASHPPDMYAVSLKAFSDLSTQVEYIQNNIQNLLEDYTLKSYARTGLIQQGCLDTEVADIYLLVDESGSISTDNFQQMKTFLEKLVEMFDIGPEKVLVRCVLYSDSPREISIGRDFSKDELKSALQNLRQIGGGTNTGKAINFTQQVITKQENTRPGDVPVYLIVLTDGESQDSVKEASEIVRDHGVNTYAIGVRGYNKTQLLEITGAEQRVHLANDFDSLKNIKDVIAQQICSGKACEGLMADILFLIDSSSGMGPEKLSKVKTFMKDLVNKTEVGLTSVQFAAVQFSNSIKEEFQFNKHATKNAIWDSIDNMKLMGNVAKTGNALTNVADYFAETKGARPSTKVSKILILITDNPAEDEVKAPADTLSSKGVVIYSIGGFNANKKQLQDISGRLKAYFQSFDKLETVESDLLFRVCNPEIECKRIEVADIVFVIDSSGSIDDTEYKEMQNFMVSLVNKSSVGPDNVQFGALKYSDYNTELFYMNRYKNKLDIINHINKDKTQGGDTYTAGAMKFSREFFTEKHGSRKARGVPQIVMVLTDGESHDKAKLNETARQLEQEGLIIYAIGIDQANTEELKTMAGTEGKWFMVDNFSGLQDILVQVSEAMCNKTDCKVEQADLLFLIDGSTNTSEETFREVKNFVISIMDDFNVGPVNVHIAVSQYSESCIREINFDYSTEKGTLKNEIGNIRKTKGRRHIGAALEFTKSTVYSPSSDSRLNQGVKQLLVVITAGNASDNVVQPAKAIRDRGVDIYAVGIGNVCKTQLTQITGSTEKIYTDDVSGLKSIKKRLVKDTCSKDPVTNCSIDVLVSFDISTQSKDQSLFHGHPELESILPIILKTMVSLKSPSCGAGKQPQASVAFYVKDKNSVSTFNTYSQDLFNKLKELKVSGPSYLDSVFLNTAWDFFKNTDKGKAKMLLVFTDGLDEDVKQLEITAGAIRSKGLNALVTVALEGSKKVEDMRFIEFGRGFEYNNQMHIGMPGIGLRLARQADHSVESLCCCVFCKCYGERGEPGDIGAHGIKGRNGTKGQQGHSGDDGESGERGVPGPKGEQGIKGCQGARGLKGNRGFAGDKSEDGELGLDGLPGEQGNIGHPGTKGEKGEFGQAGSPGSRGIKGDQGHQGFRGAPGEPGTSSPVPGPTGLKGDPGQEGEAGRQGPAGPSGSKGTGNLQGRRGVPGPKGIKGKPGDTGYAGDQGAQGSQGDSGRDGVKGEKGGSGPKANQGPPGTEGSKGSPGKPGILGRKGDSGDPGQKGEPGTPGKRGQVGEDGRSGYGKLGKKGVKGQPGFPGEIGSLGSKGDSGMDGGKGLKGYKGNPGPSSKGEDGSRGNPGHPGRRGRKGDSGPSPPSACELIDFVRDKCTCCQGKPPCPVYPTELVLALDMSNAVTPAIYTRMLTLAKDIVSNITIRASNCPAGARVAIVSYNSNIKHLIRFSDFQNKEKLIKAVESIPLEKSTQGPDVGGVMKFVARNIFKRTLQGFTVRRIAVLISSGRSENADNINTAIMEYGALGIIPVVFAFSSAPLIKRAFEMDATGAFELIEIKPNVDPLKNFKLCTLCFDKCQPDKSCGDKPIRQKSSVDVAFLLDSSHNVKYDEFEAAREFLSNMIDHFEIEGSASDRVALVTFNESYHVDFNLLSYDNKVRIKKHIKESVQQVSGQPALGLSLQYTIENIMAKTPNLRKNKVIIIILFGETSQWDKQTLSEASLKAKCEGYALFVLSVGRSHNDTELTELASKPLDHHLLELGRVHKPDLVYANGFLQQFLNYVRTGIGKYPPAELRRKCSAAAVPISRRRPSQTNVEEIGRSEAEYLSDMQIEFISQEQSSNMDNLASPKLESYSGLTLEMPK
ncbi:collagen alpha-6(VI) chain [Xenopus laevis]|uniref:VWFA domain-containing protein n=2 Tax=Xenopus laevis TaxID=8355 RepID=A0A974CNK5_XENLA|nr:collagen alpha-6(VI) chain [Xenopus laevis]OCT75936.1 hypothetical protein XELAEV_18031122mg [Xenopus laevis]